MKYGRYTVMEPRIIRFATDKSKKKTTFAKCICECGTIREIKVGDLKSGRTMSCGCYQKEQILKSNIIHNLSGHPIFRVWTKMRQRCYDKNEKSYSFYGGRGIVICKEWEMEFKKFYDWAIANGYKKGLQIDRIKNNENYSAENCRFVTSKINNRNRRSTKLNEGLVRDIRNSYKNNNISLTALGKQYGVSVQSISLIVKNKTWQ